MQHLDKIYKDSDIAWFTPVELFKVTIYICVCVCVHIYISISLFLLRYLETLIRFIQLSLVLNSFHNHLL